MSVGNRSYIDKAELRKNVIQRMYEDQSTIKDTFLGREAQYEAATKIVSCSITVL